MVKNWKLCIDVSCYSNPWKSVITYVLSNIATRKVVQRKMNIPGRTTNNEAYFSMRGKLTGNPGVLPQNFWMVRAANRSADFRRLTPKDSRIEPVTSLNGEAHVLAHYRLS